MCFDVFQVSQSLKLYVLNSRHHVFLSSVVLVTLTTNYATDGINTAMFVISGSKLTQTNVFFRSSLTLFLTVFRYFRRLY